MDEDVSNGEMKDKTQRTTKKSGSCVFANVDVG